MTADLLDLPLPTLLAQARQIRDDAHGRRVTFSPKVFIPLTMLCRDKCGYCTFAQPPARLESPFLSPDEVLAIARAGAAAGCHEALFTLGERPELRYPVAAEWLAANGYASTVDYLVAMAKLVVDRDRTAAPRERGRAVPRRARRAPGRRPGPRDDARVAARRPRLPPRLSRQDAGAAPRDARRRGRPPDPLHDRHPRRHRRDPSRPHRRARGDRGVASAARPRARGDRPELPAEAGHRDAPLPRVPERRVPLVDRRGPRHPPARDPRPGAAEPLRRLRRAARRGHRRLGRCVTGDGRPREPRAALARARPAARGHRGEGLHARAATHDLPRVRARSRTLARRRDGVSRDGSFRRRGARPRRPWRGVPRARRVRAQARRGSRRRDRR